MKILKIIAQSGLIINSMGKDYTTPEQSDRLLELGFPINSANCIQVLKTGTVVFTQNNVTFYVETYKDIRGTRAVPCWTLGKLIEICNICNCTNFYFEFEFWRNPDSQIDYMMEQIEKLVANKCINFSKLNKQK